MVCMISQIIKENFIKKNFTVGGLLFLINILFYMIYILYKVITVFH